MSESANQPDPGRGNRAQFRHWLTIGGVTGLLGFMLVAAFLVRPQVGKLQNASESDLVVLLDSLSQRLARLQAEEIDPNAARNDILSGSGKEALARTREQLFAMQVFDGTVPVKGPGVTVIISRGSKELGYDAVLSLVQELRDAGAEAISINGIRIGGRTAIGQSFDNRLLIDKRVVNLPLKVLAIGSPQTLQVALQIPGGVSDTVSSVGGRFTVVTGDVVIESVVRN